MTAVAVHTVNPRRTCRPCRTHLAYKAEHVVDLKTEVIVAAEVYRANEADTATLTGSLQQAQDNLERAEVCRFIDKAVADKGYHKAETLAECELLNGTGVKTYIPEPESKWQRAYGKRLQRRRSEVVERSFAHVCDTGGARRSWLKGLENVRKRYSVQAAAHNLGLILRKLLGSGKPREFAALMGLLARSARVLTRCTAFVWLFRHFRIPEHRLRTSGAFTLHAA